MTCGAENALIGMKGLSKQRGEMNVLEDSRIVELYLSRDEAAVECTAEKYGARLRALAQSIVDDRQSAEECENDTYLQAWNAIPPHEPREYLYAFLARITRHIALDHCRHCGARKHMAVICELSDELEQCIPAPDDAACRLEERELRRAINGFLAGLKEEQRGMFLRRYWYLDSISAISKRFDCSESRVKTMLYRCRGQLRAYLEQEGYDL